MPPPPPPPPPHPTPTPSPPTPTPTHQSNFPPLMSLLAPRTHKDVAIKVGPAARSLPPAPQLHPCLPEHPRMRLRAPRLKRRKPLDQAPAKQTPPRAIPPRPLPLSLPPHPRPQVVQTLLSHSVRVESLDAVEQLFKFIAPLVEEGAAEEEPDDEVRGLLGVSGLGRGAAALDGKVAPPPALLFTRALASLLTPRRLPPNTHTHRPTHPRTWRTSSC
jgi:hypothetical protein